MSLNVTAAAATFMNVVSYASMSLAGMNTSFVCPCAPEANKLCNELIETFEQQLGECQGDLAFKTERIETLGQKLGECQGNLEFKTNYATSLFIRVADLNTQLEENKHIYNDQAKDAAIVILLALLVFPKLAAWVNRMPRVTDCASTLVEACITVIGVALLLCCSFVLSLWATCWYSAKVNPSMGDDKTLFMLAAQEFLATPEVKYLTAVLSSETGVVVYQVVSAAVSTYAKNMFGPFYGFCKLLFSELSRSAWAELLQLE